MFQAGSKMYPELVETYAWKTCVFDNTEISEIATIHPNLHLAAVRTTLQVICDGI